MVGISQQGERDSVLGGEFGLALLVQDAHAEDDGLLLAERWQRLLERARLLRAPRGVVLGIEVEDDRLAGIVREAMCLSVLVFQRERGSLLAGIDQRHAEISCREAGTARLIIVSCPR